MYCIVAFNFCGKSTYVYPQSIIYTLVIYGTKSKITHPSKFTSYSRIISKIGDTYTAMCTEIISVCISACRLSYGNDAFLFVGTLLLAAVSIFCTLGGCVMLNMRTYHFVPCTYRISHMCLKITERYSNTTIPMIIRFHPTSSLPVYYFYSYDVFVQVGIPYT